MKKRLAKFSEDFAWAITLARNNYFAGFKFWSSDVTTVIPEFVAGNKVALFESRSVARYYLKRLKGLGGLMYPAAKIVKVKVIVEII